LENKDFDILCVISEILRPLCVDSVDQKCGGKERNFIARFSGWAETFAKGLVHDPSRCLFPMIAGKSFGYSQYRSLSVVMRGRQACFSITSRFGSKTPIEIVIVRQCETSMAVGIWSSRHLENSQIFVPSLIPQQFDEIRRRAGVPKTKMIIIHLSLPSLQSQVTESAKESVLVIVDQLKMLVVQLLDQISSQFYLTFNEMSSRIAKNVDEDVDLNSGIRMGNYMRGKLPTDYPFLACALAGA